MDMHRSLSPDILDGHGLTIEKVVPVRYACLFMLFC